MPEGAAVARIGGANCGAGLNGKRGEAAGRILAAGGRLFANRGLAQVSVEDILAEAKVSRRTFYAYFANKYELVASLINPALAEGVSLLTEVRRQDSKLLLPGIVDAYVKLWNSHQDALSAIESLESDVMPYIEMGHKKFVAVLKTLLDSAAKAGELRNDDAQYTFQLITRTAVPLLKVYADHPDGQELYRAGMLALLGNSK